MQGPGGNPSGAFAGSGPQAKARTGADLQRRKDGAPCPLLLPLPTGPWRCCANSAPRTSPIRAAPSSPISSASRDNSPYLDLARIDSAFREKWGAELLALFTRFQPLLSQPAWQDCHMVLAVTPQDSQDSVESLAHGRPLPF
ncbi:MULTISPECIES: hypothetical protein [unclassified Streptomyces]|uniref:hypothetical protein n=1 Tax=unclassified Streptomyces TaxID=2593676 RepID=UPI0035DC69F7